MSNAHRMMFDLIGKLFYPRLPYWQRRRNAKILAVVALFALVLAVSIVLTMWLVNNHFYHSVSSGQLSFRNL